MNSICSKLSSREQFSKEVESEIQKTIVGSRFISIAFDEWTDLLKRRYVGIVAQAVKDNTISCFTLGLVPLKEMVATGDYIDSLVKRNS